MVSVLNQDGFLFAMPPLIYILVFTEECMRSIKPLPQTHSQLKSKLKYLASM
jgi:hypothetical protein